MDIASKIKTYIIKNGIMQLYVADKTGIKKRYAMHFIEWQKKNMSIVVFVQRLALGLIFSSQLLIVQIKVQILPKMSRRQKRRVDRVKVWENME